MLLSLIVPAFHAAATLARASRSALQPGCDIELIIVDDCSQDDTLAQAHSLAAQDARIRVLRTASNGGPGMARNAGIEAARGSWIGFLDADDEFAPQAICQLLPQLAGQPDDIDMLAFDWCYSTAAGAPEKGEREDLPLLQAAPQARILAYLGNRIDPSVIFHLYRRDFLHRTSLRFRSGYHEDVDFSFHACSSARRIAVLPQVLYRKWNQAGSIVNTLGTRHADGYFDAIDNIHAALLRQGRMAAVQAEFAEFVINILASRLVRLLRGTVHKTDSTTAVLCRLYQRVRRTAALHGVVLTPARQAGQLETRYQKMFAAFMAAMPAVQQGADAGALLTTLDTLSRQSWSCYDLHHALFLAPDEIRTCCKRYFHKGEMKGDVVLLHGSNDAQFRFTYDDVLREKQRLHRDINRNSAPECEGCPFLSFADWGSPMADGVKYLSMEYHSVCNMRCTYCSPTYYSGQKARYDVAHVTASLADSGALAHCEYVVWGGGEPTLDKQFVPLAGQLAQAVPRTRQRVISNATKYLPELAQMLAEDKAFIVTSIDAGTKDTFQAIRKFSGLDRVLAHLQRYVQASAANTLIKYIALDNNLAAAELDAFADQMQHWQLLAANFQLSCDFRSESLSLDEILAIAGLYHRLYTLGAEFVFLDDLIWQRLPRLGAEDYAAVHRAIGSTLADASRTPRIAVWGTGAQARLMMGKSRYLQACEVACFIDPRPHLAGTRFMDRPIYPPAYLQENSLPVVIAAVQSAPFIYQDLQAMDLAPERIVQGLVL
ncbi:glycosyltransferase [Pseudogulbenkiania sp. MAI-1]|uniref:glycosyltransferase n=1 Tax=Pseudogulbenkiania sp. MAI-1 TaxID=990370 RepID=UPI00045E5EAD|nr:glycosyltransferase [Pseudogulbenkiania sp. MAI-1]